MSFKALTSKITKKFDAITAQIPSIGVDIKAGLEKTLNDFKAETGIANIENALGKVSGLNIGDLTSQFATLDPGVFKTNLPAKPGPISFTTKAGTLVPGKSAPPWPNELEPYASHNAIITLACLTYEEINDPINTFRRNGFSNIVLRSGGTASGKKVRTRIEQALGADVEFFITELEFESLLAPNPGTTTTNALKFDFTVQEPYSMGLFWQALQMAAYTSGYDDYTQAPFCFQIDFKGWNVDGVEANVPYAKRLLPVKLTKGDFSVNEGGTNYKMEAIAWNEQALTDSVQGIKTDIAIKGRTVKEILQTGAESLTEVMNARLNEFAQKDQITTPNQYIIIFPNDTSSANSGYDEFGMSNLSESRATVPVGEANAEVLAAFQSVVGSQEAEVPITFNEYFSTLSNKVSNSQIEGMWKKYAASNYSNNLIGQSAIIEDPVEAGVQPMNPPIYQDAALRAVNVDPNASARAQETAEFKEKYAIFNRTDKNLQISDDIRVFKFKSGTRIQEIIEEVVITSIYGRSLAQQLQELRDPQGMITWYRVETDVFIVPDHEEHRRSGNYPSLYVYRVVPYKVHHSVFSGSNQISIGTSAMKRDAAKQYNYIYTGKNKDILNFNIEYNYAFLRPVAADRGSSSANQGQGMANQRTGGYDEVPLTLAKPNLSDPQGETPGGTAETIDTPTGDQSAGLDNARISVARQFNERLMRSNVDMVMVDMEIMGDPFYISDSGVGNYHAEDTSYTNMTADGHMNANNGQVYVNILFRTPIDIDTDRGDYIFPEELITVDQFSGLYFVPQVRHKIIDNQFTQELTLVRMINQQETTSSSNVGALVAVENARNAVNERATTLKNQLSEAAILTGTTENYEVYLKEVQELLPGFESLNAVVQAQRANLSQPALAAFDRIAKSFTGAQAALDAGNLYKIGTDFRSMIGSASTLIDATSTIDNKLKGTLEGLGLDGDKVLGALGSAATNNLNSLSRVKAQIPNAVEQAATEAANKLKNLNSNLRGPF